MTPVFGRFYGEHRRLMLLLLGVMLFNGVLHFGVKKRLDSFLERAAEERRSSRTEADEALLERGSVGCEALLLASARDRIADLTEYTLKSNAERFPLVDRKIKAIAKSFGLASQSYSYGYVTLKREELEQLTVSFHMKGSYADLRLFVSEVEQAKDDDGNDLFFAIEQVGLQDSTEKGSELNLNLVITTYFEQPQDERGQDRTGEPTRGRRTRQTRGSRGRSG